MNYRNGERGSHNMTRRRKFVVRALVLAATMLAVLAVCELVLFRFIWKPSAIPAVAFENGVLKYAPNQRGVHRIKNEVVASFRINDNGWNSGHAEYIREKTPGKVRIAVIGDSYVEALDVDYDQSLAERLERLIGPDQVEVYRFGNNAIPMSQYLQMMRYEVGSYQPDVVIALLVRSSFENSYLRQQGVYTSSFLKLRVDSGTVLGEIAPEPYKRPWYNFIRTESGIWGYWMYRRQVRLQPLRALFLGAPSERGQRSSARVEAASINDRAATDYVVRKLAEYARGRGIELLLVMDGARRAIYDGVDEETLRGMTEWHLSRTAQTAAEANEIPFLDLHPVFQADFARNRRRFDFVNDAQFNEWGHAVVARALCEFLGEHGVPPERQHDCDFVADAAGAPPD